ncbi:hypothetical protein PWT90_02517 [Aphanocladium album]|nr:hypothetical protein PWT90_02517 [Aphanocladium album]
MLSSRLQQRLQSIRCAHSLARNQRTAVAGHPAQRRLASSTPRPPPPRSPLPPKPASPVVPPAARQAAPSHASSAAATRARLNADKEVAAAAAAAPAETAEEYQARYKSAARRWTLTIIALPILLVTSYYLFDRRKCRLSLDLYGGRAKNNMLIRKQWL